MTRYAIYAVPGGQPGDPEDAVRLYRRVADWFAREDVRELTVSPRRYGFHGTLKAPFRLAAGRDLAELQAAADAFAAARTPVVLPALRPTAIGGFRALVPSGETDPIDALAADTVRDFEPFRAPLTAGEIARRDPDLLSPRQRELLEAWGYPYVLDEFRFHLTLTDSLDDERGRAVDEEIAAFFAEVTGRDIVLTGIDVFAEPEPGAAFERLSHHRFGQETP